MKIQINRITKTVAGVNAPSAALYLEVSVDDGFTVSKTIEEVTGYAEPTEGQETGEPIKELRTVTLPERPDAFTMEEVVAAKYTQMLEASSCDYIVGDVFLDENDLDLADPLHSANTGLGILQLLPNGQAKTKPITLEAAVKSFSLLEFDTDKGIELKINDVSFVTKLATLPEAVDTVTLTFLNTTGKPLNVRAYAVGY